MECGCHFTEDGKITALGTGMKEGGQCKEISMISDGLLQLGSYSLSHFLVEGLCKITVRRH